MIRPTPRQRALWFLAAALLIVVSCLGDPTGPSARTGGLSLAPRFSNAMASAIVDVSAVRVRVNRPGESEAVVDTVIQFPANSDTVTLALDIPMQAAREEFELRLAMTNAQGDTVFRAGPLLVTATTSNDGEPAEPTFTYVGTGANATGVRFISPPASVPFGATVTLAAEAFDGQSNAIAGTPIGFELATLADTVRARITNPRLGTFVAGTQRGDVAVRAVLASGQVATHTITVQPVANAVQRVSGNNQVGTAGQPLPAPLVAKVVASDALGVQGIAVEWAVVTALGDTIATETDTSDANGNVSYSLTLGASAEDYEVYASMVTNPAAFVVFSATAQPAAPARLAFTSEPLNRLAAQAFAPAVQVAVVDAQGNVNTAATDVITLQLFDASDELMGAGALTGTASVAAVGGFATFAGLAVNPSGTGYTLRASASALAPDTSATFDVANGPAVALVYSVQPPAGVISGLPFAVELEAHDAGGNRINIAGTVTVALGANPGGGTLGGTLTAGMSEHVSQFGDLTVDAVATGYTLVASSSGLTSATSNAFAVTAPPEVNAWVNPAGGNWSNAANWSRGTVPSATDTVWIKLAGNYTVAIDVPVTAGRVEVGGATGAQVVDVNSTLTLADTIVVGPTVQFNLTPLGNITGTGDMRVLGHFGWSGGSISGAGLIRVPAGGTMAVTGTTGRSFVDRTIELGGLGLWGNTHTINSGQGATWRILPGGNLDIQGDADWVYNQGGAPAVLDIQGSVLRTTSANRAIVPTLSGSGALGVMNGSLEARGTAAYTGDINVAAGATFAFGSGTHALAAGAMVSGAGFVTVMPGAAVTSVGGWNVTGTTEVAGGALDFDGTGSTADFMLTSGRKGGSGTLIVTSDMLWEGGDLNGGGGTTVVDQSATLTIDGAAGRSFVDQILEHRGVGSWLGAHTINSGVGAELLVTADGELEINGNPQWIYNQGGAQTAFVIQGSVSKTSTGGAIVPGLIVQGSLLVQQGTLEARNTGVSSGVLEAGAGGVLLFTNGSQILEATSTVQGAGFVQVGGANVSTAGTWAVTGTTQLTGGIFTFNGSGSTGTLLVDGGSRRGTGLLNVTSLGSWTSGGFEANVGITRFLPGSALTISGIAGRTLTAQALEVGGTAIWAGNHVMNSGVGGVLRVLPGGTLDLQGNSSMVYNQGGAQSLLEVQGSLTRTTSGGVAVVAGLSVSGTLQVTTGTLEARNTGTSSGTVGATAGATLRFASGIQTLTGPSNVVGAGVIDVASGSLTSSGGWAVTGTTLLSGGTLTYDGPGGTTGALDITAGVLGGTGLLTVTGAMAWSGGGIAGGDGTVRVAPAATFASTGGVARSFTSHVIEILGTGTWTGTHSWNTGVGAILRVAPGATLDIQGDPVVAYNQGGVLTQVINEGTLTRSTSAGTVSMGVAFHNTGALNVGTGVLSLVQGGSLGGTATVAAGATLSVAGATVSMLPAFDASGPGEVLLAGGALTGAVGDVATFDRLRLTAGTLTHAGTVQVTQQLLWDGAANIEGGGTTRVESGAALDITTNASRALRGTATLENAGTATWSGDAQLFTGQGARIVNLAGASFDWAGNGSLVYNQGGATPHFVNEGSFNRTGSAISGIGALIVDTVGTEFRIQSGELQSVGGARFGGPGVKYTGGYFVVAGGTVSLMDGSTWSSDGGGIRVNAGTLAVDSGGTAVVPGIELNGGSIAHEGRLDIFDAFTWTGGSITSNTAGLGGETHVGASANVLITGAGAKALTGTHRFANAGTVVQFDGTGNINGGDGAVIDNAGTFEFDGTGQVLHNQGGTARFVNQPGAILQVGGTSVGVMGFPIDNAGGVLSAQGAALRLTGGSVNNFFGNSVQTGGIPIELGGGAFALTAPFNFGGNLTVSNATVDPGVTTATVNGDLSVTAGGSVHITQAAGVFTVDGDATFAGSIGTMSAGRLDLAGNLTQVGAGTNFQPSGTHITRFNGSGHQVIAFGAPGVFQNRFQHVELFNSSATDSVVLASGANAAGNLTVQTGRLGKVAPHRFVVAGDAAVVPGPAGSAIRPFVLDVAGTLPNGTTSINPDTLILNRPGAYAWTNLPSTAVHQRFNAGTVTFSATSAPADLIASGTARLIFPAPNKAVLGDLATENSGVIEQSVVGSDLSVNGDASFNGGSTFGALTAGRLTVAGNFTQGAIGSASSFAPNGTHVTVLSGNTPASVNFANSANSFFDSLQVSKGTAGNRATITLATNVRVNGGMWALNGSDIVGPTARLNIAGGTLSTLQSTQSPTISNLRALELAAAPTSITASVTADTVVYNNGVTVLPVFPALQYRSIRLSTGAPILMASDTIIGDLDITSGVASFAVGSITYRVNGKLRTRGAGQLQMTNFDGNLTVVDSAIFGGATTNGIMTNGTLRLLGHFVQQGGNAAAFAATASHSTWLAGGALQTVFFANPGNTTTTSHFANMRLENASAAGVRLQSPTLVVSQLVGVLAGQFARVSSLTGDSLYAEGINADSVIMDGVPLRVGPGTFTNMVEFQFLNMPTNRDQLVLTRTTGGIMNQIGYLQFPTAPGAGNFALVVRNNSGTALTLNVFGALTPVFNTMVGPPARYSRQGAPLPTINWGGQTLP